MKKTLKEHRKSKQYSQQDLADASNISVRTIQRIEAGLSTCSPYVIKTLCKSLEIGIEELTIEATSTAMVECEEETNETNETKNLVPKNNNPDIVKWMNLSALSVILFPLLNLILPCIIYWRTRKSISDTSKPLKLLSFQLVWSILTLLLLIFIPAIIHALFGQFEISGFPIFTWVYFICVAINVVITLHSATKIVRNEPILEGIPSIL